jgi:hypothetical protein
MEFTDKLNDLALSQTVEIKESQFAFDYSSSIGGYFAVDL